MKQILAFLFLLATVHDAPALAADAAAGTMVFQNFCESCHGPAERNFNNILAGANNPTAIQIQMQRPGSTMAYLQDLLDGTDIANVAAYLALFVGDTSPPTQNPSTSTVVEYHHAEFDHYFITAIAAEIAALDAGTMAGWQRTGQQFTVYATPGADTVPVCRFFTVAFPPTSSHFYTPSAPECALLQSNRDWTFEAEVFDVDLPDATGACRAGTRPVYRLYNAGQGGAPNHRYTTELALRAEMIGEGWVPEGFGDVGVIMCVP